MTSRLSRRAAVLAALAAAAAACARGDRASADGARGGGGGDGDAIVVYNAGSLARPLRAVLDSFARAERVRVEQENAGSLETARKLTELGKVPDAIALADEEVFPRYLMPAHVGWYARFARNRMVLAYTDRSKFAAEVTPQNWWEVVQRPGVEMGRSDPNLDPNGYRTLLVFQLAESFYARPGLAERLLAHAPPRNMRPKEADLVGLLQAGEMDYVWSYESIARGAGLRFVQLPEAVDLSAPVYTPRYERATVRVAGKTPAETLTFRGAPIVYAFSIPRQAPHPALAARFAAFLVSETGRRILRAAQLDALDRPEVVGTGAPAGVGVEAPAK
ncbi:MAG TPA: extracellular solute-binding protein [Gemmatimonadaceae bacterium]|nr:extracellular solute-binding protein [Gemmatimonadaceae bacterium]